MSSSPENVALLTIGGYRNNDADFNGCHAQAIAALRHLANYPRPDGGEQSFNSAHLEQIAEELQRSWGAISKAVEALKNAPVENTISIQEAWVAAGGNPGIPASREDLLAALRALDEAEEEATVTQSSLDRLKEQWPDTYRAFVGAFDTPDARLKNPSDYAEDARARLSSFNELLSPAPLTAEEQLRSEEETTQLMAQKSSLQAELDKILAAQAPRPRFGRPR